jgi:NAD(P)-dependent dehydrogenase (short-subunit alcohol dehydrogenase family)|tara:strand:+ start:339 stop:1256 length:918 start_codon:yes stop_codon:yes gene_type:complete
MTFRYDNRVAIVTGAGNGLGRSHALGLAARGAKVIVNDLGGAVDGSGSHLSTAETVVEEIRAAGGEAIANGANVTQADEVEAMVQSAIDKWGRVDILVNNAGILRDKSFSKMSLDDFRLVLDVHLMGAAICSKAVWDLMKEQQYGRIVMTSSSSGIYGNFGQSNYGAAKMGVVGLMNVLHLEGAKYGIRVNALSPTAATRMTEGLIDPEALELMTVESVTAGLLYLVGEEAPARLVLCAGAGGYAATRIYETDGIYLSPEDQTPENIALNIEYILDTSRQTMLQQGADQTIKFIARAAEKRNRSL